MKLVPNGLFHNIEPILIERRDSLYWAIFFLKGILYVLPTFLLLFAYKDYRNHVQLKIHGIKTYGHVVEVVSDYNESGTWFSYFRYIFDDDKGDTYSSSLTIHKGSPLYGTKQGDSIEISYSSHDPSHSAPSVLVNISDWNWFRSYLFKSLPYLLVYLFYIFLLFILVNERIRKLKSRYRSVMELQALSVDCGHLNELFAFEYNLHQCHKDIDYKLKQIFFDLSDRSVSIQGVRFTFSNWYDCYYNYIYSYYKRNNYKMKYVEECFRPQYVQDIDVEGKAVLYLEEKISKDFG